MVMDHELLDMEKCNHMQDDIRSKKWSDLPDTCWIALTWSFRDEGNILDQIYEGKTFL